MRCLEVVSGVLHDPTRVDRLYASVYRAIMDARRLLRKSESSADIFYDDVYHYAKGTPETISGPAHGIITACNKIGTNILVTDHGIELCTSLGPETC